MAEVAPTGDVAVQVWVELLDVRSMRRSTTCWQISIDSSAMSRGCELALSIVVF